MTMVNLCLSGLGTLNSVEIECLVDTRLDLIMSRLITGVWSCVQQAGERLKQTGLMWLEAAFSEQGSLGRRLRDLDDGKTYL